VATTGPPEIEWLGTLADSDVLPSAQPIDEDVSCPNNVECGWRMSVADAIGCCESTVIVLVVSWNVSDKDSG
jgi:hypothetical protein